MDYAQIVIDIKRALTKYEDFANRRNFTEAKTEALKILSSAKLLQKTTDDPKKV